MELERMAVWSTTVVRKMASCATKPVTAIMASRPWRISEDSRRRRSGDPGSDCLHKRRGSNPRSPGLHAVLVTVALMRLDAATLSTHAVPHTTHAHHHGLTTVSRPPLRRLGLRPWFRSSTLGSPNNKAAFRSQSSAAGHPTAANMASRLCFSSASFSSNNFRRSVASLRGSNPALPSKAGPSPPLPAAMESGPNDASRSSTGGAERNGRALLIFDDPPANPVAGKTREDGNED
mmetsp:Transcript_26920/g.55100  ORF Transcript_26920/g.55100 Transcript_26920/m.55100 type:complete len:234 (-) Transcript_26920:488-1189(-)